MEEGADASLGASVVRLIERVVDKTHAPWQLDGFLALVRSP
jgi:hypothetical protein